MSGVDIHVHAEEHVSPVDWFEVYKRWYDSRPWIWRLQNNIRWRIQVAWCRLMKLPHPIDAYCAAHLRTRQI